MNKFNKLHIPVMVSEMLHYLAPEENNVYLDCTFGAGGYSEAILESCNCRIVAFDQDPSTLDIAQQFQQKYRDRFTFFNSNFLEAKSILQSHQFDGIVMDLGVSSMQLDNAERGFSFRYDAELDMRMSQSGCKASEFINTVSGDKLADVIFYFGEERKARRIASAIINARKKQKIVSTLQLADIVREAVGQSYNTYKYKMIDPATKTFQAIRIFINNELSVLSSFLEHTIALLAVNARLVVVSFHSLEDVIVKNFLRNNSIKKVAKSKYRVDNLDSVLQNGIFTLLTKKIVIPSRLELINNPRSRSARLRAAQKTHE